ncbi:MAG TPA: tape measure protein [Acidimicrobiia bacterium]|nr:tape measure protein [Acidimicrobiia bacterium]
MKKTLVALVVAAVVLGGVGVAWSATSGGGTSSGPAATPDAVTAAAATATGAHPALRRMLAALAVKTAADTIHVDRKTLVQELRSGKSIADVANEHNVSPDTVSKAIVDAATNRLSSLQSSGKLTADQVQKIEQRLPQAVDKLVNHKGTAKGTARARLRQQVLKGALQTAADTIHIDRATLVQELRSGKSIADVANEHNVSPDTVSKAIVDAATKQLSSLQSSGKLTADQVQKIEQRLPQAVDKLVNRTRGQHAPATTNGTGGDAQQSSIAA